MATKWGAKTAIGDSAAQASWDKNWMKNESKKATSDRVRQARDEADAEVKRETRGVEEPMTAGQKQSMQETKDEEDYQKRKTAPTTKTEMGKGFAEGGKTKTNIGANMADKKPKEKPQETNYLAERSARLKKVEDEGRHYGRTIGRERQEEADTLGGPLGTPAAYVKRAGQYIGDKITDADAYLSEKAGMQERAAARRGERAGLKEEGYAKGGMTASARADGCATKGKTKGRFV
jgi:hypothetical protein